MTDRIMFLGKSIEYWIELQSKVDVIDNGNVIEGLLLEVRELRGKVGFYESRIKQMADAIGK